MHQQINPKSIFPPFAHYSHGMVAEGRLLFVSGQLGVLPDGTVPESTYEQAVVCFNNVEQILFEAGLQSGMSQGLMPSLPAGSI